MNDPSYGFGVTLSGGDVASVVQRVTAALGEQGFGVLSTIDVAATVKKKLDVDFRPYVILGACNPKLAIQALGEDAHMGLLLPCNVVVQAAADPGSFDVSFIDPHSMVSVVSDPGEAVGAVADDARRRLKAVAAALKS